MIDFDEHIARAVNDTKNATSATPPTNCNYPGLLHNLCKYTAWWTQQAVLRELVAAGATAQERAEFVARKPIVLIDLSPSSGTFNKFALMQSSAFIIPATPDSFSRREKYPHDLRIGYPAHACPAQANVIVLHRLPGCPDVDTIVSLVSRPRCCCREAISFLGSKIGQWAGSYQDIVQRQMTFVGVDYPLPNTRPKLIGLIFSRANYLNFLPVNQQMFLAQVQDRAREHLYPVLAAWGMLKSQPTTSASTPQNMGITDQIVDMLLAAPYFTDNNNRMVAASPRSGNHVLLDSSLLQRGTVCVIGEYGDVGSMASSASVPVVAMERGDFRKLDKTVFSVFSTNCIIALVTSKVETSLRRCDALLISANGLSQNAAAVAAATVFSSNCCRRPRPVRRHGNIPPAPRWPPPGPPVRYAS